MEDATVIEQASVKESMQMTETKDVLMKALQEPDPVYEIIENKPLKENWITAAVTRLGQAVEGNSTTVISFTDANLALQNERGFASAYLKHLGSNIDVMTLKDIVGGQRKLAVVKRAELDFPTEPRLAWVEDELGRRNLISTTKIDGVQVELDMHAIGKGPETTGVLHPILRLSTK